MAPVDQQAANYKGSEVDFAGKHYLILQHTNLLVSKVCHGLYIFCNSNLITQLVLRDFQKAYILQN
jgi:DNA-directed RNA polymerase